MITILAAIARRLGWLEVHEPPLPDDLAEQSRQAVEAAMRQALLTEVVEWRELALDPADVEADLLAWEREYQTRSAT